MLSFCDVTLFVLFLFCFVFIFMLSLKPRPFVQSFSDKPGTGPEAVDDMDGHRRRKREEGEN